MITKQLTFVISFFDSLSPKIMSRATNTEATSCPKLSKFTLQTWRRGCSFATRFDEVHVLIVFTSDPQLSPQFLSRMNGWLVP